MAVQSKPFVKVLAVACVAVASFGCGGDDAPASEKAFCDLLAEQNLLDDLDPSVAEDRPEIEAFLAELSDLAPTEVADDIRLIQETYEAVVAEDEELLSDPEFQERAMQASVNLEEYRSANCEAADPVDTADPSGTTADPGASVPAESSAPPDSDPGATTATMPTTEPALPEVDVDDAQPVVVTDSGVGVFTAFDEPRGTWAATITNPNDGILAEFVEVQATFKDASGAVIDTQTDYLDALLPGETRAVGSDYLDTDPADIVSVDVIASTRNFRAAGPDDVATLSVSPPAVERTSDGLSVLAEVTSTDDEVQTSASAVGVIRDAGGRIIGALTGYVGFVPAGGSVGVEAVTSLVVPRDVTVEMFLDYSLDPWITDDGVVDIADSGFLVEGRGEDTQGTWAVIVDNPDTERAATFVQVVATFRDADGQVVDVDSGSIAGIGPSGRGAYASEWMYGMPDTARTVEVVALASTWVDDPAVGEVTASGVRVRPQEFGGVDVTGELVSTFERKVESLNVVVVFRSADGALLGGSSSYVEFVPAGGSVGFSISSSFGYPRSAAAEVWPGSGDAYD
jgi:hypothetical protein